MGFKIAKFLVFRNIYLFRISLSSIVVRNYSVNDYGKHGVKQKNVCIKHSLGIGRHSLFQGYVLSDAINSTDCFCFLF